MLQDARFPAKRFYAVEVSGWDGAQSFFVEKCELEWNEESGKQVALKHALSANAIVLVRLMQSDESDRSHPIVYEAELVGKTGSGLHRFRLSTAVPRLRETESSAA
jgi:hypothetical protein